MAEAPAETMEDLLTCSLCLELFKEPKTLTCLHSYCIECLKEMTKNNKVEVPITCPLCRDETTMPSEGIEGLPTNFFIKNMMDVMELRTKNENPQCSNCEDGQANCRCMECEEFFCQQCLDAHNRLKTYQSHRVVDLEKLFSPASSKEFHPAMKCGTHEEVCRFYCRTCNVLICRDCTVLDHPRTEHTVANLKDIADQCREGFLEAIEKAEKHITKVKMVQDITRERRGKLAESLETMTTRLNRKKDYLIEQVSQSLESQVSGMLADVEQFVSNKIQQDEKDEKQQGSDLKRMGNYVLFMRNLLASGNDDEMMNMYEDLVRCLDDPKGRNPFWLEGEDAFVRGLAVEWLNEADDNKAQDVVDQMKTCLGELSIPKTLAIQYELVKEKGKVYELGKDVDVLIDQAEFNAAQGRTNHPDLSSFHAKILSPKQTVIPAKLKLNEDGSLCVSFVSYIQGRHRLAVRLGDNALRGSPLNVDIRGDLDYSPGTSILQELQIQQLDKARKTFSAEADLRGNIYILLEDQIHVFDSEFNLLYAFGERGAEAGQMMHPWSITLDTNEHVIVSDIGKHQLLVFDKSGTFIQEIGSKGADPGQLNYPLGVAGDLYGNTAVCDAGNYRIQVFNHDATFKFSIGGEEEPQVMFPIDIHFNSRGHIIVSESSLWTQNYRLPASQGPVYDPENPVECVKIFDRAGQLLRSIGASGEGKGQFWAAVALTVDSQDHIWITDFCYGKIQVFSQEGNVLGVFSTGEEKKGTGWLSVLTTAANGAVLYYRSFFDTA